MLTEQQFLIKAKIQELVPEIMELKFGCEILVDKIKQICIGKEEDVARWDNDDDGQPGVEIFGENDNEGRTYVFSEDIDEILGSLITLAVVLRAIHKGRVDGMGWITVDTQGQFINRDGIETGFFWNLTLDSYDQQSEECKRFIGTLLGV